jgi:SAM-dependent methyltransferase
MDDTREQPIEYAKNRAHDLLATAEADLAAGRITEAEYYSRGDAVITPAYLAGDNPRSQSGHSGSEDHWQVARSHICSALHNSGTFLDVGCASGYLMECVVGWAAAAGLDIEPHGLDLSPQLADLARQRVPHWAHRIHTGNVIDWQPPQRYDFVRTGLEYVPRRRRADLLQRLLDVAVAPRGRLILGSFSEEVPDLLPGPSLEEELTAWGFAVSGRTQRPHYEDRRLLYKTIWIDL